VIAARRPWAAAIDRAIGAVVEPVAAALVVVEVLVLGAGVFFRYALRSPLDWTDELAGLVLVWLAMLGAVVAYRRGEHIRLAALPRRVSAAVAELLEAISCVVVCAFALELAFPAYKLFLLERIELTPSLSIPRSYEVLPIEVGLGAIFVLALVRLCELDRRAVAISVIASLAVAAALWTGRGALAGLGTANLLIFFVGFVGL
jgi:TRAP-type C4-dicarboxylate transport system permease small subunit